MAVHASHAALPYPIKGARYSMLVPLLDADGDPTAATTPDTEISEDNAAATDAVEEISAASGMDGMALITFTGAETDCSTLAVNFKAASGPKATLATLYPRVLAEVGTGTLSAGSAGGGTLGTLLAYDVTGCFIKTTGGTGGGGTGGASNQVRKIITYNTGTGAFTVAPNWETTPSTDTTYAVLLPEGVTLGMLQTLNPTTAGRKLDVSAGGEAGIDWANVGSPTTTLNLSGTTVSVVGSVTGAVGSVTGAVGSVTANVNAVLANSVTHGGTAARLVLGSSSSDPAFHVTSSGGHAVVFDSTNSSSAGFACLNNGEPTGIGILAPNANLGVITANITGDITGTLATVTTLTNLPAITAGWLTATGIAADAFTAAKFAADVTTEFQSGLATAAALDAVDNFLDTEIAAIKGVTDKLDTALELDGAVYRYTANALEQAPSGTGASATAIADEVQTRTIAAVTTVGTVTNAVTLPSIPAGWITTAGINDGAFTAAKFAASSLDDKGNWLKPTTAGRTLDVTATGAAGIDWGNVENATTSVNLSGTSTSTVATVTNGVTLGDVAHGGPSTSITAGLGIVGDITGSLSGSVGSVTGLVSLAANAITSAKIQDGAFTAAKFAASSLNGKGDWATATTVGSPAGASIAADIAAVKTDTAATLADTGTDGVVVAAASKTGYALSAAGVQAIWDALTSALTTVGSIGKWIVDKLVGTIAAGTHNAQSGDAYAIVNSGTHGNAALLTAIQGVSAGSGATAQEVWEYVLTGSTTAGQALLAAQSAGDPWSTNLPGSYGAGTAGYTIGNLISLVWSAATRTVTNVVSQAVSPMQTGTLSIVRGDTYANAQGTQKTISKASGATWPTDLTGGTITFTARRNSQDKEDGTTEGDASVTSTGAIVTATGDSQAVRFDLTASQTDGLTCGAHVYDYDVQWASGSVRWTLERGTLTVFADQTLT